MSRKITNALFRHGRKFRTETEDFHTHSLLEAKEIAALFDDGSQELYRIPVGATSDLASTPQILWSIGLPPFGVYAPDCYAHDAAYRGDLEVFRDGAWVKAMLSKDESDDLLHALMFSGGVPENQRTDIYQGVKAGGQAAFDEDRKGIACLK